MKRSRLHQTYSCLTDIINCLIFLRKSHTKMFTNVNIITMKNSQRTKLTKRKIGDAYLELRRRFPIERIRITELCRLANSNRTTFYHYFEDVYDLNEAVENRILEECFENFPFRGLIYTDPDRYLTEFSKALEPHREDLIYLAKDRETQQYAKLNRWLVNLAKKNDENAEEDLILTYVIAGVTQVISENKARGMYSEEQVRRLLNRLIRHCLNIE